MTQFLSPVEEILFSLKRSPEKTWECACKLGVREQNNRELVPTVRDQSVELARPFFPILL
jgi:hypothetical protein